MEEGSASALPLTLSPCLDSTSMLGHLGVAALSSLCWESHTQHGRLFHEGPLGYLGPDTTCASLSQRMPDSLSSCQPPCSGPAPPLLELVLNLLRLTDWLYGCIVLVGKGERRGRIRRETVFLSLQYCGVCVCVCVCVCVSVCVCIW